MIVLLAHGSPDPRHAAGVAAIADAMGVPVAYLQHHGPDLPAAVAEAAPDTQVGVLPLLLSAGVHVADDVPELINAAREARTDLAWRALPTMPPAELLPAVLEALVAAGAPIAGQASAHAGLPAGAGDTLPGQTGQAGLPGEAGQTGQAPARLGVGAVGVAAGSSRPGALEAFTALVDAAAVAGVDLELANGPRTETAEAIDRLRERGHHQVWVVPLLFADGILGDIAAATAAAAAAVPTRPVGEFPACPQALVAWARKASAPAPTKDTGKPFLTRPQESESQDAFVLRVMTNLLGADHEAVTTTRARMERRRQEAARERKRVGAEGAAAEKSERAGPGVDAAAAEGTGRADH